MHISRETQTIGRPKEGRKHFSTHSLQNCGGFERLLPIIFHTEIAIRESFLMSNRTLVDEDVRIALEWLIQDLQKGSQTITPRENEAPADPFDDNLTVWNIRRQWNAYFQTESPLSLEEIVQALRTILDAMKLQGGVNDSMQQGYLEYLEGTMAAPGSDSKPASPVLLSPLEKEYVESDCNLPIGEELLTSGLAWIQDNNLHAKIVFGTLAEEMIANGETAEICEICIQLMRATNNPYDIDALDSLLARVRQHGRLPVSSNRGYLDFTLNKE